MRIIEILYQIVSLGSSFLGLDLAGRDNSGELLGLRSKYLDSRSSLVRTLKEDSIKLEYSGIRFTWDILVKRLNNSLTFLSLILWNDHQTNPVIVTTVHVDQTN